jgi:hypothetical protein
MSGTPICLEYTLWQQFVSSSCLGSAEVKKYEGVEGMPGLETYLLPSPRLDINFSITAMIIDSADSVFGICPTESSEGMKQWTAMLTSIRSMGINLGL